MSTPSLWTIALKSLRYYARPHLTVALGVATATAVIVGALVVGDSVRHSLRSLVIDRLANIECLLQARVFFRPDILDSLTVQSAETDLVPAIIFSSTTVEKRSDTDFSRASRVQILAVDERFASRILPADFKAPGEDEIAVNQLLATELQISMGDEVTLLVDEPGGVPSDNPLGRREDRTVSIPRQKVVAILPDQSIGGVNFLSNQSAPRNVFASLSTVQEVLECGSQVNAVLVLNRNPNGATPVGLSVCDELNLQLHPSIEDYGLKLERHRRVFPDSEMGEESQEQPPKVIFDYYQLSSSQLILNDATSDAVFSKLGQQKATRLITYLANTIEKVEPTRDDQSASRSAIAFEGRANTQTDAPQRPRLSPLSPAMVFSENADNPSAPIPEAEYLSRQVPYSIMVGMEDTSELPLNRFQEIQLDELYAPYCWINRWLAEQMNASPGDWLQASFFEPETVDGNTVEKSMRFMIAGIVPLTEPEQPYSRRRPAIYATAPTAFNDPNLTPNVPGITDQDSILNWDLPFDLEEEIDPVDDEYWNNHRLTPKVFLPYLYASARGLFASRFGKTTAIRFSVSDFPNEAELRQTIEDALLDTRSSSGLEFLPVRDNQLKAASGTTPFDVLFLSLSFFVIVAALLLVYLLLKLGIQQRLSELGILLAQGFAPRRIRNLLLGEFTCVAWMGAITGVLLGLVYARAIIAGLESWWLGAIATRFLSFHASGTSLLLGSASGFLASLLAIFWGIDKACKRNPLSSLRGREEENQLSSLRRRPWYFAIAGMIALGALTLMFAAAGQTGMAKAGTFFGSGMLLLIASMFAARQWIEVSSVKEDRNDSFASYHSSGGLYRMAWRAIGRNPSRSLLSLSLLSVATFLIASMGVFQMSPTEKGYGGFNLIAESSQPIYRNIGSVSVRKEAIGDEADLLSDTTIVSMRAKYGEDASCNNLFQVAQPTVLGVSKRLQEIHDISPTSMEFEWAQAVQDGNPWSPLAASATGQESSPIPVILDQNTALWSLKQGASLGAIIKLDLASRPVYFKTVALLSNSVLQGKLLISEENFQQLYPEVSGYSYFLINSGRREEPQIVAETLEKGWASSGLDVQYSQEILKRFLGVQNTYISAFQSLGALGLLLGTFGLIAVQVRSVLERRREFAVMRAVGFSPGRIARILTLETAILLGGGLLMGVLCALVALVPYVLEVGPELSVLSPLLMLLMVMLVGFVAALITVRTANKQSVLDGLRGE